MTGRPIPLRVFQNDGERFFLSANKVGGDGWDDGEVAR
jgi:hypothetical protein